MFLSLFPTTCSVVTEHSFPLLFFSFFSRFQTAEPTPTKTTVTTKITLLHKRHNTSKEEAKNNHHTINLIFLLSLSICLYFSLSSFLWLSVFLFSHLSHISTLHFVIHSVPNMSTCSQLAYSLLHIEPYTYSQAKTLRMRN